LEGRHKDILVLAENVSKHMATVSDAANAEVMETAAAATKKYQG